MMKRKWLLAVLAIGVVLLIVLPRFSPDYQLAEKIRQLPDGAAVDKIKMQRSQNNVNPYDTSEKLDNLSIQIKIKENRLTDREILALGLEIQELLNREISEIHSQATGNALRVGFSIFPLSETILEDSVMADGYSHYRVYDFDSNCFVWQYHAYQDMPQAGRGFFNRFGWW